MGALLSLPALSYILPSSLQSYTTSLNLLLFSLTWSTLILSHPPLHIEIIGTLIIQLLFYLLPLFTLLLFERLFPDVATNLRAQARETGNDNRRGKRTRRPAPPGGNAVVPRVNTDKPPGQVVLNAVLSIAESCALVAVASVLASAVYPDTSTTALNVSSTPPMPWTFGLQIFYGFLFKEGIKYVASLRTARTTRGARSRGNAEYDMDNVVRIWLPVFAWAVASRAHVLTYFVTLALCSVEGVLVQRGLVDGEQVGGVWVKVVRRVVGV